jgi:hypothetical protein
MSSRRRFMRRWKFTQMSSTSALSQSTAYDTARLSRSPSRGCCQSFRTDNVSFPTTRYACVNLYIGGQDSLRVIPPSESGLPRMH